MGKLTFKEKYSYGIGALGKDLVYAIVSTYLMIYFTDVVGLKPAFVGTLFLAARLWDTINDPMMGMIVDNTRTKWGKFRPWIFIGTVLNAVVLVFLFRKPDLEGTSLYVYFSVMYILWGMTYTIMDIPYWSMIPALSRNKEEREEVSVIPRIFASTAWLIIGALGIWIVKVLGGGDAVRGYGKFAFIIAIIFVISSLITCINVKERTETPKNAEKVTFKQTLNIIRRNDQLVVFIGIVLGMNLVMQISGGTAIYYFKYVTGDENLFSFFTTFAGLAEIAGLMLYPILTKKIGRETVFKIGGILPIVGFILLLVAGYIAPQNIVYIAISGIVLKLGSGLLLGSTTVMLADVVDYGQFKLGTRNESIVFSVQTLLVKCASAVSGWLVGVGLDMVGYVAGAEQTAMTILGLRFLMVGVPIISAIVMCTIYVFKYKLNGEYHDNILKSLSNKESELNMAE
ncbi:melibiose:sodium transporter MelB [Romboutsia sp. Marseille-P6047]|uniref:melibiose:sodium transporter MelB n=1 Tax=Romboutsia sp. Marseille-P6047 TaxID=2161817 RepID=UPI000F0597DE|nr:melibiose:sodium transporter MelB [Romboutsia sp. Marseille-P6047]